MGAKQVPCDLSKLLRTLLPIPEVVVARLVSANGYVKCISLPMYTHRGGFVFAIQVDATHVTPVQLLQLLCDLLPLWTGYVNSLV